MLKKLIPLPLRIKGRQFLDRRRLSLIDDYRKVSSLGSTSPNEWIRRSAQIPGWLFEGEHEFIFEMASRAPQGDFVEIGCLFGKSTCIISGAIKQRANGGTLYAIDPFSLEGNAHDKEIHRRTHGLRCSFPVFLDFAKSLGFYDGLVPIASFSYNILPRLQIAVGFAFIDGCHEEDAVRNDFDLIRPLAVKGAILLFHDVAGGAFPGVSRALDKILKENPSVETIGQCGTIVAVQLNDIPSP